VAFIDEGGEVALEIQQLMGDGHVLVVGHQAADERHHGVAPAFEDRRIAAGDAEGVGDDREGNGVANSLKSSTDPRPTKRSMSSLAMARTVSESCSTGGG